MLRYNSCPIPQDIIKTTNRILVIGDLHADYNKTIALLKHFNLINNNNKWIGKNTIIVQMGDQVDGLGRGSFTDASGELKILELFDDLHHQALIYGGAVYSILGNHEIMNVEGIFTYASQNDINTNGGIEKRRQLFRPGGAMAQHFSCTRNSILKINNILFVHGGIHPDILQYKDADKEIKVINKVIQNYLNGFIEKNDKELNNYFNVNKGIIWDRSMGNDSINCNNVDKVLKHLNADHIIIGHTPQGIINSICNNKVWRVDVGLSKSMGSNKMSVLEIKDGEFNVLY